MNSHVTRKLNALAAFHSAEGTRIAPDDLRAVATTLDADAGDQVPEWVEVLTNARNVEGPGLIALCAELLDDQEIPPALREIARRVIDGRLYRDDRPRARSGDPETSQDAARRVGPARPGGSVHKLLRAYADVARTHPDEGGRTSREIEWVAGVKAAHKRTSELLTDGLLEVVMVDDTGPESPAPRPRVRAGGRVLTITARGREELARLDTLAAIRRRRDEDRKAARVARVFAREARKG